MNKKLIMSKKLPMLENVCVYYYLTKDRFYDTMENVSSCVYGVEVEKISTDEFGIESVKKSIVYDLSCNEKTVELFIRLLGENDVTPVSLYDIVSDKMEEGYFDNINYAEEKIA